MFESEGEGAGRKRLADARRVVVKVGSSLLTSLDSGLETSRIESYCQQIGRLLETGREVILVTSGSIAEGCKRLGWARRPAEVHLLQAAAAVGQMGLIQVYEQALRSLNTGSAMVMLTHEDLADRQRYLNARATLGALLRMGVVPIINENDTVATDEIRFGDNDTLGALVANLVEADALIICTPNYTHFEVLQVAMQSGKPILLEKPMATILSDAAAIVAASEAYSSFIQVGLQYRYKSQYVEAFHEARTRLSLGGIKTISMSEYRPPFLGKVDEWNKFTAYSGGTLVEKCCHYFDLINRVAQSTPKRVFASGGQAVNFLDFEHNDKRSDIDDHALVIVEYDNGVRGQFALNMFLKATVSMRFI